MKAEVQKNERLRHTIPSNLSDSVPARKLDEGLKQLRAKQQEMESKLTTFAEQLAEEPDASSLSTIKAVSAEMDSGNQTQAQVDSLLAKVDDLQGRLAAVAEKMAKFQVPEGTPQLNEDTMQVDEQGTPSTISAPQLENDKMEVDAVNEGADGRSPVASPEDAMQRIQGLFEDIEVLASEQDSLQYKIVSLPSPRSPDQSASPPPSLQDLDDIVKAQLERVDGLNIMTLAVDAAAHGSEVVEVSDKVFLWVSR